jgi:hypothetical protein
MHAPCGRVKRSAAVIDSRRAFADRGAAAASGRATGAYCGEAIFRNQKSANTSDDRTRARQDDFTRASQVRRDRGVATLRIRRVSRPGQSANVVSAIETV